MGFKSITTFFRRDLSKKLESKRAKIDKWSANEEAWNEEVNRKFEELDEAVVAKFVFALACVSKYEDHLVERNNAGRRRDGKALSAEELYSTYLMRELHTIASLLSRISVPSTHLHSPSPISIPSIRHIRRLSNSMQLNLPSSYSASRIKFFPHMFVSLQIPWKAGEMNEDSLLRTASLCLSCSSKTPISRLYSDLHERETVINSHGKGPHQFDYPYGLTIHPQTNNLYIGDSNNHRIQVLSPTFEFLRSIEIQSTSTVKPTFNHVRSVAFSPDCSKMACVDNHSVHILQSDGTHIHTIGNKVAGPHGFHYAQFVISDQEGFFYVSDRCNNAVKKFDFDGNLIVSMAHPDESVSRRESPCGIMINDDDELMVLADGGEYVRYYDLQGKYLREVKITKVNSGSSNFLTRGPAGGFIVSDMGASKIYCYTKDATLERTIQAPTPVGLHYDANSNLITVGRNGALFKF
eukprot:TRINITY_DN2350_c0_g1_i1.p1 TRINITY_DN2350_c0_g1~~TRINITY_DN2350_c0_g1_i1.p1  ORF type:complete len:465 (+),score=93.44 TRINITY_DN2350_c0_g1_i1:64-1458(+)